MTKLPWREHKVSWERVSAGPELSGPALFLGLVTSKIE